MEQFSFFETAPDLPADLLQYIPDFFDAKESSLLFTSLLDNTPWRQETQFMYGREVKTPRLTAWYGDERSYYKYSGQKFTPLPWTDDLLFIKHKIEPVAGVTYNSVLLNYYRDGNDSVAWHSDDEPELGVNPHIASVNFGQIRRFDVRHKLEHSRKYSIQLENGSLLLMKGDLQHAWQHQVPKSAKATKPRINLTFRTIIR